MKNRIKWSFVLFAICLMIFSCFPVLAENSELETQIKIKQSVQILSVSNNLAMDEGENAILSVEAKGSGLTYQWAVSSDNGTTYQNIAEAITSNMKIIDAKKNEPLCQTYLYRITVTDDMGISEQETVRVLVDERYRYETQVTAAGKVRTKGFLLDNAHLELEEMATNNAKAELLEMIPENHKPLLAYEVHMVKPNGEVLEAHRDRLDVTFSVGNELNGKMVNIYHLPKNGRELEAFENRIVNNGLVTVTVDSLSPFLITGNEEDVHSITATVSSGGTIYPEGEHGVPDGSDSDFIITPDDGYDLLKLLIDGEEVNFTGTDFTFENVEEDHTICAEFIAKKDLEEVKNVSSLQNYSIMISCGENGTVSPSGTIQESAGSSKTIYFYPNIGYIVDQVLADGAPVMILGNSYTIPNINKDMTIDVSFKPDDASLIPQTHIISATCSEGGEISPNGEIIVSHGGDLNLTFIPDKGYEVDEVLVDDSKVEAQTTYRFTNITKDRKIHVTFKKTPMGQGSSNSELEIVTVTVIQPKSGGTISPSGILKMEKGSNQTFYFFPESGYTTQQMVIGGSTFELSNACYSYTIENIQKKMKVSAKFKSLFEKSNALWNPNGMKVIRNLDRHIVWLWMIFAAVTSIAIAAYVKIRLKHKPMKDCDDSLWKD